MKVGIIGGGQIARVHGPLILKQPDVQLVGLADKDVSRVKALAADLQAGQVYSDAEVMIKEQRPDIVHVLVPPQLHCQLSLMAMSQGCHVLVEKPMALTMADSEEMVYTAKQGGVRLCVNHNMIFDDVVQKAMGLASGGAIGELISVEASFLYDAKRNPALLEDGAEYSHWAYRLNGGLLQDLMPHMAALVFEFIPTIEDVKSISLNRGVLPKGWDDEIRVLMRSDALIGYINISLNEKPDTISLVLKGKRGIINANLFSGILSVQTKSSLPRAVDRGLSGFQLSLQNLNGAVANIYRFATGRIDKSGGIERMIARFYDSVKNGTETPVSTDKSLRVVDLMTKVWPAPSEQARRLSCSATSRKSGVTPTALVTGASGFIGTHLIKRLLAENVAVRALVRPNSIHAGRLRTLDVEVVEGSLDDAQILSEATRGIKTIYHAGAVMNNNWEEHQRTNINGTEYLIRAALANHIDRLVYLSTLAVYEVASLKKNTIISEDSPYQKNPKLMGPYAYSKIEAEKMLLDAHREQGLQVTVVRPGIVLGPLGRIFLPHLGYRYQDKLFLIIDRGNTPLPITYVENTVDGIYKASTETAAIGQIYNLVDGQEINVREYLERFIQITGTKAKIISLPYIIPYLATTAYEVSAFLNLVDKGVTSRAQLKGKQVKVRFDSSKARTELGWIPRVSLEEGLDKTFSWYAKKYC
jgi:2-alkyl-3-oxoalkanoate reductase